MSSSQRHHFIPRFIQRKYAAEDQPPAAPRKDGKGKSKATRRSDHLVNKVDLDNSMLTQRPISTEFALMDMYRDPKFYDNPYHLEEKFSRLENQASEILTRACNVFARGRMLELNRLDVDRLRKFLFLMKYRNSDMFDRYNHDHVDSYAAEDRERMLAYMDSKGFTKPRDVWFDNLRQLLDLDMDTGKSWMEDIQTGIYPDDAMMFKLHLLHSFMAFCEPMSPVEEFLLTQNAYSIFEGPSSTRKDLFTGNIQCSAYNEHHNFAPVTPRLIIILRSHWITPPAKDGPIRREWDLLDRVMRSQHLNPDRAGSILQNLPVQPCKTTYVHRNINSRSSFHKNDQFTFPCFKLSSAHITTINNLLLEEACRTSSIVYRSATSLKSSLERYLEDETDGMKTVLDSPLDSRRVYLITLEKIVRDLRGTARCKTRKFGLNAPQMHMALHVAAEVAIQLLQNKKEKPLPWVYSLLKPGTPVVARHTYQPLTSYLQTPA